MRHKSPDGIREPRDSRLADAISQKQRQRQANPSRRHVHDASLGLLHKRQECHGNPDGSQGVHVTGLIQGQITNLQLGKISRVHTQEYC